MQKILIATTNSGKVKELKDFFNDLKVEFVSLSDLNVQKGIKEDGLTYEENSKKKAVFYSAKFNMPSIADDGGIEISALGGLPGVRSRRWAGRNADDKKIMQKIEKISKELPDNNRTAFFKTVVSFALPNGKVYSSKGQVRGIIAKKPHKKLLEGYPYRSYFYLPVINKYYHEAELTKQENKLYNHRYKACQKLKILIRRKLKI